MVEPATVDAPRKRGRPPKARNLSETVPPQSAETPPFPESATDSPAETEAGIPDWPVIAPKVSAERLFEYWNALSSAQRKFGTVYAYRLHPKMQLQPWRGQMVNENCEKFNDEDGPLSREAIFKRRRLGIYLLRLSKLKSHGQISQAELEIRGEWTADNMPILDIDKLDLSHPSNAEYIRILKVRGILKPEDGKTEGAEDMAAQEVLGDITKTLLNDRIQERQQQQPQQQQPTPAAVDVGVGKELVGLLREQINQNRPASEQGTVLEMVEALTKISKANTPPPADMTPFVQAQQQYTALVEKMMLKDVERAEAAAAAAKQEAEVYKNSIPKPLTFKEQLAELDEWDKTRKRLLGKAEKDENDEDDKPEPVTAAGFWGGLMGALPTIIKGGVELLREANVMMYNYKLNGTGAPPLNPATGQPGTEPLAPAEPDEPQLSPEDQAKMDHMQNVVNQLSALAPPMLNHLLRNKTGIEFARFVIENYGPQSFALIQSVEGGKETILAMIQQYPPVWNQIAPARVLQFQKFLDEFMGYSAVAVQ